MKTNFGWTALLDFIDQSILYSYVGDKIKEIRETGLRCAMELSEIQDMLESGNRGEVNFANDLIKVIAKKLQWDTNSVTNMIRILAEDDQLNFVYDLWSEAFPKQKNP